MNQSNMQEHFFKESLKRQVDHNPNFSDQMKWEIKAMIDAGHTPEEIVMAAFSYLPEFQWR